MMNDILTKLNYDDPNKLLSEISITKIDMISERKLGKWREESLL